MHLYKIIEEIRPRPGMYLGTPNLSKLQAFLGGYQTALHRVDPKEEAQDALFPLPFWFFHEYVARRFDYYESTSGWCNMILDQTAQDEEKGLQLFYTLLDEFRQLGIGQCFAADLSDANIAYHNTDEFAPGAFIERVVDGHRHMEGPLPLYKNPVKVFYAKLTNDAKHKSYLGVIRTDTASIVVSRLYKSEKEVLAYFESCFGAVAWQKSAPDLMEPPFRRF